MTYTEITSRKNKLICDISLLTNKKQRESMRLFVAEGIKLLTEAIISGSSIEKLFFTDKALKLYEKEISSANAKENYLVTDEVYAKISDESSPQGILCCIALEDDRPITDEDYKRGGFLILEDIQNPLNIGAIFRCAYSMGVTNIIMTDKCACPYGPKSVRAAMGSLFKLNIYITHSLKEDIIKLKSFGNRVFCTALNKDSLKLGSITFSPSDCIIIGNEGHGVSEQTFNACDNSLFIPMNEGAESLNAATAAAIVMWEMKKHTLQ